MPAKTTQKGEFGEAMVIADLIRQGHDVAIPFGHNQPFDLIVVRKEDGRLEKVQFKYTTSDEKTVRAIIGRSSAWVAHRYTGTPLMRLIGWSSTRRPRVSVSTYRPHSGTAKPN